jgi:hypothetical protein
VGVPLGATPMYCLSVCYRSVLISEVTHRLVNCKVVCFGYGFVLAMVKICQSFVALRCISFVLLTSTLMRSASFQKKKKKRVPGIFDFTAYSMATSSNSRI